MKQQASFFPTDIETAHPKCGSCSALCCRYATIPLDPPEGPADFDHFRWLTMHGVEIHVTWEGDEPAEWQSLIPRKCDNLLPHGLCKIYSDRPQICASYDPDNGCDKDTDLDPPGIRLLTPVDVTKFRDEVWIPLQAKFSEARQSYRELARRLFPFSS